MIALDSLKFGLCQKINDLCSQFRTSIMRNVTQALFLMSFCLSENARDKENPRILIAYIVIIRFPLLCYCLPLVEFIILAPLILSSSRQLHSEG